jgi:hypothetical protein
MDDTAFDRLSKFVARLSRRDLARALRFVATAVLLTPVRIARAELEGVVVLGGACSSGLECRQQEMQAEAICADNGFASDGALNCCVERGCCGTDADCCGDLRCAPTGDVCSVCRRPPFATRGMGQRCASDNDCIASVVCDVACLKTRCACRDDGELSGTPERADLPDIPATDAALAAAEVLSRLEVTGQFADLYDQMHPDAQAVIPVAAVTGWYENESPLRGAAPAEATKVRFIPWMWDVTGKTYPETADVAFRQRLADGTVIRAELRLVQDDHGEWRWFFGRDRAFVEKQIARYGS